MIHFKSTSEKTKSLRFIFNLQNQNISEVKIYFSCDNTSKASISYFNDTERDHY